MLAPIPGGRLAKDAAAAWNAPGGPGDAGLFPTGDRSTYRLFDDQVFFWNNQPPLAARPGTSNHGWGTAADLRETWMRAWIDEHGGKYGWRKTEAFSEWWHVNYDGSAHFPTFVVLDKGSRGKRVKRFTRRLAFIRRPGGDAYLSRPFGTYRDPVVRAVRSFQRDQKLGVDGEIGPKTAAQIDAVFRRQYQNRHEKPRRGEHGAKRSKRTKASEKQRQQNRTAIASAVKAKPKKAPPKVRWKLSYAARFIARWEGFLPEAYLDTIAEPDIWTIGFGHTGDVRPGERWSKAKALRVLVSDIRWAAKAVARNVKVPLTTRQRIALISLVFNCGPGAIEGSTLQRKLNNRNYDGAADELLEWSHAGGVVVEGLLNRRKEERWMFLHSK
jgi:lysozyme